MAPETREEQPAKVTLGHLVRAERICPRRLRLEHANTRANFSGNARWQVSNRVTEEVRLAHTDLAAPGPDRFVAETPELGPEQRAVYELATRWYTTLFTRPVRVVDDDDPWSTDLPGDLRLVGRAGLAFTDAGGAPELRLLGFGGRPEAQVALVERPAVRFALARREAWLGGRVVRIAQADVVRGTYEEDEIDTGAAMPTVHAWLSERVELLRERLTGKEEPGLQCAWCPYIAGCPPMRGRA
jgi:hypothetical protein